MAPKMFMTAVNAEMQVAFTSVVLGDPSFTLANSLAMHLSGHGQPEAWAGKHGQVQRSMRSMRSRVKVHRPDPVEVGPLRHLDLVVSWSYACDRM